MSSGEALMVTFDKTFVSAAEMETALTEAAEGDALILTATSRLARRVLHAYRLSKIHGSAKGWKTPSVSSFNRWVKNTFDQFWEPVRPLSKLAALRLWQEAVRKVPLPEGLNEGPFLYLELQRAFDTLTRHRQEVTGSPAGYPLADWRREVSRHFIDLLEDSQYISWGEVLERLGKTAEKGRIGLPERIILTGFDLLSPIEETLVKILSERSNVSHWRAEKTLDKDSKVRVYATPEQECRAVCAEILSAWNDGQKELGLIFLDQNHFALIRQCFEELTDREERPPGALRYNLTLGTPLSEHPLFQTAMIPLRLQGEPAPNRLLSSLLTSPYVRKEREDWDGGVRAALWMSGEPKTLRDHLSDLEHVSFPIKPMHSLATYKRQPLKAWLESLESVWKILSFPVCRCETDTLAEEHLFDIVEELKKEAGHVDMDMNGVLAWVASASQGVAVVEKTPETAGIQILNLIEARGLSFERLWVVGTHGRALPELTRNLPFLDPDEIRNVEGGTAEAQWEAGKRNLSYLLAAAPHVTFTRASSEGEDTAYLPCPLIPDESSSEESQLTVDLWKAPPREWLRARWLREGLRGIENSAAIEERETNDRVGASLHQCLEVTQFEDLLSCPFKYFAARLLKLEALGEMRAGMDSAERGTLIHRILHRFTRGLAAAAPDWPEQAEKALAFLEETVDDVLGERGDDLFREVERLRLLGDDHSPGLLKEWLREEQKRAGEGWRFEASEAPFEGLPVGNTGITLKGRVDRIDSNEAEGKILWDYKTGNLPPSKEVLKEMVRPQLPAYLLSLRKGLLPGLGPCKDKVRAGYIFLKNAPDVTIDPLKDYRKDVDWDDFLPRWEEEVAKRIEGPLQGLFRADPKPPPEKRGGACECCAYSNLCGIDSQKKRDDENEE